MQLQQTELAFLTPPRQRSQCRYFNVERLVKWANELLNSPLDVIFQLIPKAQPKEISERLKQKFTWLGDYEQSLKKWEKMVFLTRSLEKQVKIEGFNLQSFLATTDILESLFGKYKEFSSRCPLKELRQMLLTIPLSTMNLTTAIIKQALETIKGDTLEKWLNKIFEPSMLSKRKTLFRESMMT